MGDLGADTAVRRTGDGTFEGRLSPEWEIWGPMGGYLASFALRAVGETVPHLRPATFACHYLNVAAFDTIDVAVQVRKQGRRAASLRVDVTQQGRPILDASVWAVDADEGPEHDEAIAPDVAGPAEVPDLEDLLPADAEPPFPFWRNFQVKPIDFRVDWPPPGPLPAVWREWLRFVPTSTFDDPWLDAARSVILVDLPSWPAAMRPHAWTEPPFVAPTLDLSVAFHRPTSGEEWLLCDGAAPVSTNGLFGWTARVWSTGRSLVASGGGQCLYRRTGPAPS